MCCTTFVVWIIFIHNGRCSDHNDLLSGELLRTSWISPPRRRVNELQHNRCFKTAATLRDGDSIWKNQRYYKMIQEQYNKFEWFGHCMLFLFAGISWCPFAKNVWKCTMLDWKTCREYIFPRTKPHVILFLKNTGAVDLEHFHIPVHQIVITTQVNMKPHLRWVVDSFVGQA